MFAGIGVGAPRAQHLDFPINSVQFCSAVVRHFHDLAGLQISGKKAGQMAGLAMLTHPTATGNPKK